jgi:K+-sensing histidine kinase KdpD
VNIAELESLMYKPFSRDNVKPSDLRLCVARRILEMQGGTMQLEARQGAGVEVKLSLPAVTVGAGGSL